MRKSTLFLVFVLLLSVSVAYASESAQAKSNDLQDLEKQEIAVSLQNEGLSHHAR